MLLTTSSLFPTSCLILLLAQPQTEVLCPIPHSPATHAVSIHCPGIISLIPLLMSPQLLPQNALFLTTCHILLVLHLSLCYNTRVWTDFRVRISGQE